MQKQGFFASSYILEAAPHHGVVLVDVLLDEQEGRSVQPLILADD